MIVKERRIGNKRYRYTLAVDPFASDAGYTHLDFRVEQVWLTLGDRIDLLRERVSRFWRHNDFVAFVRSKLRRSDVR